MTKRYFDRAYGLETQSDTDALYRDWAESYDDEVGAMGYATPGRVAAALRNFAADPTSALLDYGCGTGVSGAALAGVGFTSIDGMDPSPEMLAQARAKGIYRDLLPLDLSDPAPVPSGRYPLIAAIGVIGAGAAPLAAFDLLMRALPRGGLLGLSFNDATLADPSCEGRVSDWTDTGAARLKFREHGPHLREKNINATVYVIERA